MRPFWRPDQTESFRGDAGQNQVWITRAGLTNFHLYSEDSFWFDIYRFQQRQTATNGILRQVKILCTSCPGRIRTIKDFKVGAVLFRKTLQKSSRSWKNWYIRNKLKLCSWKRWKTHGNWSLCSPFDSDWSSEKSTAFQHIFSNITICLELLHSLNSKPNDEFWKFFKTHFSAIAGENICGERRSRKRNNSRTVTQFPHWSKMFALAETAGIFYMQGNFLENLENSVRLL